METAAVSVEIAAVSMETLTISKEMVVVSKEMVKISTATAAVSVEMVAMSMEMAAVSKEMVTVSVETVAVSTGQRHFPSDTGPSRGHRRARGRGRRFTLPFPGPTRSRCLVSRDPDLAEQSTKEIEVAEDGEVRQRRGVADDDHPAWMSRRVERSCSRSWTSK
jgi:hypothetical protein